MLHSSTVFTPFLPSSFSLCQVTSYFPATTLLSLALPPLVRCLSHTEFLAVITGCVLLCLCLWRGHTIRCSALHLFKWLFKAAAVIKWPSLEMKAQSECEYKREWLKKKRYCVFDRWAHSTLEEKLFAVLVHKWLLFVLIDSRHYLVLKRPPCLCNLPHSMHVNVLVYVCNGQSIRCPVPGGEERVMPGKDITSIVITTASVMNPTGVI